MNKRALTLMEIIVSLTILSITMVGLLNVFISTKKHSLRSRSRVSAGELAKHFVDSLQMQVRQDWWETAGHCLWQNATGASDCPPPGVQTTIGNMTYTPTYTINTVSGTQLKRVKVVITWTTR